MAGADLSPAVVGNACYYLSYAGVCAFDGGQVYRLAAPFGTDRFSGGVGGSDGVKYFISMSADNGNEQWTIDNGQLRDGNGIIQARRLYVYHTEK